MDLFAVFSALPTPWRAGGAESFSAASLPGVSHRIGKDADGWPALLLVTSAPVDRVARIRLEHLDVQHGARCRITSATGAVEEGVFTVVRCTEADEELTRYFLRAVDPILRALGPTPSASSVSRAIASLVELFRALTQPAIKSVSGLWAELKLIRRAADPMALVAAWHATPEEKYDFNCGTQRLEVKSTSLRERIHHFSLEQLTPPSGCRLVVVSMYVERSGAGMSLGEVIDEVQTIIGARPDLQERVDRVVAATLGSTLRRSLSERFDRELADDSLQIYDGSTVPRISVPLPWGISDVHFRADLSQCVPISSQDLSAERGIFGALK